MASANLTGVFVRAGGYPVPFANELSRSSATPAAASNNRAQSGAVGKQSHILVVVLSRPDFAHCPSFTTRWRASCTKDDVLVVPARRAKGGRAMEWTSQQGTVRYPSQATPPKIIGKPYAGKLHVRSERGLWKRVSRKG